MFYNDFLSEFLSKTSYADSISWDTDGEMWLNGICLMDLIRAYGSPLEIQDTRILTKRGSWWKKRTAHIAQDVGFTGGFDYFYASKANMSLAYTKAAYRSGWMAETSSSQDLEHIKWMYAQGEVDRSLRIICNGYKVSDFEPIKHDETIKTDGLVLAGSVEENKEVSYADNILLLHSLGFDITPILDTGELNYFLHAPFKRDMKVGLRLKFGKVSDDFELSRYVSRHGMMWEELLDAAASIERSEHLVLSMLHVMVGAAETIDVDTFVESLLFAAEKYFHLKQFYPSLRYLNIGGGIPPFQSGYDYDTFLRTFLTGMVRLSEKFKMEMPCLVYELGSFLADECGMRIYKIVQRKVNHISENGIPEVWCTIDGGLMSALPDMFIIDKSFQVVALNNGTSSVCQARLGDLSCDTDGRYPRKGMNPDTLLLPDTDKDTYIAVFPVGAYQKMLSGAGGAHHCGVLEAGQVILEEAAGTVRASFIPPQTSVEYQRLLGYSREATVHQHSGVISDMVNVRDTSILRS